MNGKRGLSQVVSAVLLILLTVALAAGLWAGLNGYLSSSMNRTTACNDIIEKVKLNPSYTCYDSSSGSVLVSISRKEFAMDSLSVSILEEEKSKSFSLENTPKLIEEVSYYSSVGGVEMVALPGNESGKTYCVSGFLSKPISIIISPVLVCNFAWSSLVILPNS